MKRWFNILPDGPAGCKILVYGYISQWDEELTSKDFVTELSEAEARYQKINIHINSNGGDVFEGLAIFNALRNSTSDITIYIDGVAASIASVIAMCGKPVYMNRFSRLMIHNVKAGSFGGAEQMEQAAKEIRTIESALVGIFSQKTGLAEADVKAKWFDGQDHWFTAAEALEAKLINGVFDGVKIDLPVNGNAGHFMRAFNNSLIHQIEMKNLFKKLGFKNEAPTEDEVIDKVDAIEADAAAEKQKVDDLTRENADLKAKLKEKEDAEKAARTAEIDAILNEAVTLQRFQEPQRPHYKAILEKDFENGKAIIASLSPVKRLKNELGNPPAGEDRSGWTFDDYHRKDPKSLEAMRRENPDQYKALYKNKFAR
ncbi:MAG: Clp protease ClpP [Bacteroidales bacterium]|nr:Clp protease ClpP [Bacteroidales bacterium]